MNCDPRSEHSAGMKDARPSARRPVLWTKAEYVTLLGQDLISLGLHRHHSMLGQQNTITGLPVCAHLSALEHSHRALFAVFASQWPTDRAAVAESKVLAVAAVMGELGAHGVRPAVRSQRPLAAGTHLTLLWASYHPDTGLTSTPSRVTQPRHQHCSVPGYPTTTPALFRSGLPNHDTSTVPFRVTQPRNWQPSCSTRHYSAWHWHNAGRCSGLPNHDTGTTPGIAPPDSGTIPCLYPTRVLVTGYCHRDTVHCSP